jgi:hypothetical protein
MYSKFILIYTITRWKKRGYERMVGEFLERGRRRPPAFLFVDRGLVV